MAKEEKRVLTLDKYEHGVVINALNEMRNDLIGEKRPTDIVDEVLLKAVLRKMALLCHDCGRCIKTRGAGSAYLPGWGCHTGIQFL